MLRDVLKIPSVRIIIITSLKILMWEIWSVALTALPTKRVSILFPPFFSFPKNIWIIKLKFLGSITNLTTLIITQALVNKDHFTFTRNALPQFWLKIQFKWLFIRIVWKMTLVMLILKIFSYSKDRPLIYSPKYTYVWLVSPCINQFGRRVMGNLLMLKVRNFH